MLTEVYMMYMYVLLILEYVVRKRGRVEKLVNEM